MAGILKSTAQAVSKGSNLPIYLRPLFGATKLTGKGLWGLAKNPVGRIGLGAGIGAGVGFFGTDYESLTMTFGAMTKGAIFGGLIGATPLAAKTGWKLNRAIGRRIGISPLRAGTITGYAGARGATRLGFRAGRFAFEHPLMTAGAVGAGAATLAYGGGGGQSMTSPTLTGAAMNVNYNRQAAAAYELQMSGISPIGQMGTAPQMMGSMHRAMQHSTEGLVQGMHRGRH